MTKKIVNVGSRPAVIRLVKKTGSSVSFSQGVVPQNAVNNSTELSFKLLNKPENDDRFVLATFDTPNIVNPNTYVTNSNVYSINENLVEVNVAIATNDPNYTTRNVGVFMKFKPNELQYLLGDRPGEANPRHFSVAQINVAIMNPVYVDYTIGSIIATRGVYFNDLNYYIPVYLGTLKHLEESWYTAGNQLGMVQWYSSGSGLVGLDLAISHQIPVTSVTITNTDTSVVEGDEIEIEHTILPANADVASITYSSNNPSVATFADPTVPIVNVIGPGNFTVTVSVTDILGTTVQTTKTFAADVDALPMLMTFTVNNGEQISLTPTVDEDPVLLKLDWGDNTNTGYNTVNNSPVTHTFINAGTYTVKLYATSELSALTIGKLVASPGLRAVTDWGDIRVWEYSFRNCVNLTSVPTNLNSSVKNLTEMFMGCTNFNQNINGWDVSEIQNFESMFQGATSFNQPLNTWVTSSAVRMDRMFAGATSFNQDISGWDVDQVIGFSGMFDGALAFNQDISLWNVSSATDMSFMFREVPLFNKPIGIWDVSQVLSMESMFQGIGHPSTFNQDISMWDVSNVGNMDRMFKGNNSFNQNLRYWCVSNIVSRPQEFTGLSTPIGTINEPRWGLCPIRDVVVTINGLDSPIQLNDIRHLTYTLNPDTPVQSTVWSSSNENIATIDPESDDVIFTGLGNVTISVNVNGLYSSNRAVTVVDVLQPMTLLTTGAPSSLVRVSTDSLTGVTVDWGDGTSPETLTDGSTDHTFTGTGKRFIRIQPINDDEMPTLHIGGDIEEVVCWHPGTYNGQLRLGSGTSRLVRVPNIAPTTTSLSQLFEGCEVFNQNINDWDTSNIVDMTNAFRECTAFNQPLNNWDVSNVTHMDQMFLGCDIFNQDIGNWDVSNVVGMDAMFSNALLFNQNLAWWCVVNIATKPFAFDGGSALTLDHLPTWGTCPSRVYTLTVDPVADMDIGDDAALTYDLDPEITVVTKNWTTEDATIATVDNVTNTVTAVGAGTTKLHLTINHVFVGEVTITVVQGTVVNSPDDFEMHRVMSPINLAGTVSES